eukprot:684084-Heterocapsa_arctica.AAC.1
MAKAAKPQASGLMPKVTSKYSLPLYTKASAAPGWATRPRAAEMRCDVCACVRCVSWLHLLLARRHRNDLPS